MEEWVGKANSFIFTHCLGVEYTSNIVDKVPSQEAVLLSLYVILPQHVTVVYLISCLGGVEEKDKTQDREQIITR